MTDLLNIESSPSLEVDTTAPYYQVHAARWSGELILVGQELEGLKEELEFGEIQTREIFQRVGDRFVPTPNECLVLSGAEALSFLTDVPDNCHGDNTLKALVECSKFLLELLCHGQTLPIFSDGPLGDSIIRWEIAFSRDDFRDKFKKLSSLLPRSLTYPHVTPDSFLHGFLENGATVLAQLFSRSSEALKEAIESEEDPISLAFLKCLRGESGVQLFRNNLVQRTFQAFQTWGRNVRLSNDKPELAFHVKLLEPLHGRGDWKIDVGVGVKLLPEKYILSEAILKGNIQLLAKLGYSPLELEEFLLKELGKAEKLFPFLGKTLSIPHPKSLPISTEEAFDFLSVHSSELIRSGVVVALPSWWSERKSGLSLKLKLGSSAASPAREAALGLSSLVEFEWGVALDGEELTKDEFDLLVESKKPLVFLRGRWVEISTDKLLNARKLLEKPKGKMRLVDAMRRGTNLEEEVDSLPVLRVEAEGWLKPLLQNEEGLPRREQSEKFAGSLREYQRQGLDWLVFLSEAGIGGCLADDMGLGKTVQFLALLLWERDNYTKVGPTLLVVPMSILGNWKRECDKFAPTLKVVLHHGADRMNGRQFREEAQGADLVLTTYALANRDEEIFRGVEWHRIALDEAQSIKNLNTKQSRSVRKIIDEQLTLVGRERPVERLALTGTPLENHLEELFSIFDFLNPGYLGSLSEFRRIFTIPVERYRDSARAEALSQMIRPLMLRRLKSDPLVITDLPEKIEMDEYVSLTQEQAGLYQGVLDELLPQVDGVAGIHRKGLILSVLTRLKQICDDPALFLGEKTLKPGRSGKVNRLIELLDVILDEGDSTLIFTQYAKMGDLLTKHLSEKYNKEVLFLHGSLSRAAREKLLVRFNEAEGPQIFVLSLKAGGFGLNLTRANQVIHFDQWWNPAVENQATDRAHRIGQTRSVQVRRLLCQGTLEERIMALSKNKRELAEQIVGSTREFLTEMNSAELRNLLELSVSALQEDGI